jgi:hypothetical protein
LKPFKKQLSRKRETQKGLTPWWALHWSRHKELFETRKIVLRQTADSIRATLDENNYYVLNSILVIRLKKECPYSDKFILAILNSRLMEFIYSKLTQESGRIYAEVKPKNVRKLPIPKLDFTSRDEVQKHDWISGLAGKMIQLRIRETELTHPGEKSVLHRQMTAVEEQINQAVYHLYGLTQKEIEIIENNH